MQTLHELDEFEVKLFHSEGHDVVEGEFEEHFADFLLESACLRHNTRVFLLLCLLLFDFLVNFFLDLLYLFRMLVRKPPLVVDNFQKLLPVVLVHVGVAVDLLLHIVEDPFFVLAISGEDDGLCSWDSILNPVFLVNCSDVLLEEIFLIWFKIFVIFLEAFHQLIHFH